MHYLLDALTLEGLKAHHAAVTTVVSSVFLRIHVAEVSRKVCICSAALVVTVVCVCLVSKSVSSKGGLAQYGLELY